MDIFWGVTAGIDGFLLSGIWVVGVTTVVLMLESLAAILATTELKTISALQARSDNDEANSPFSLAVLIPAHNEEGSIAAVVTTAQQQLGDTDRLIVVADNCTDSTAEIARSCGAETIERWDLERRGKGYAIDFGVQHLGASPPDIVVMLDADCHIDGQGIPHIAQLAYKTGRPIQAAYLLEPPTPDSATQECETGTQVSPKTAISAFAFRVKNYVRPFGLNRLGLPCLLNGTGMAIPWAGLVQVNVASSNLVEDMKLGIDLALAGYVPKFCGDVRVTGTLPDRQDDAKTQRRRWEHGHLITMLTDVPRLLVAAIQQGRVDLLALALEVSVPPLSLLVLLWAALTAIAAGWWLAMGISGPLLLLGGIGGCLMVAVLGSWMLVGRQLVSFTMLLSVPFYILWKIPLYIGFVGKRERRWVRTKRAAEVSAVANPE